MRASDYVRRRTVSAGGAEDSVAGAGPNNSATRIPANISAAPARDRALSRS